MGCLIKDFELRPNVLDLFQHGFIKQIFGRERILQKQLMEFIDLNQQIGITGKTRHERINTKKGSYINSSSPAPNEVDDLATLEVLDENAVTEQLQGRYSVDQIYTYVGDILIAVNPFHKMDIYGSEYTKMYIGAKRTANPPHIFAVADIAYQSMVTYNADQCIVISGESGAGKTESAHLLVQQLTVLGKANNRTLQEKILLVNNLVEAFGNACTAINDNSSRFGKYLEMKFTSGGTVVGAQISEYLLEKSRVTHQAVGEKNFHIFNYIYAGLAERKKLAHYKLSDSKTPKYLCNEHIKLGPDIVSSTFYKEQFDAVEQCFKVIGFTLEELGSVYSTLAAILNSGDIEFASVASEHQTDKSNISNIAVLENAASLLCIRSDELQEALTSHCVVARGETIVRPNTVEKASEVRDAMGKALYGRLFSWIVNRINTLLRPDSQQGEEEDKGLNIGILDIFGFENFKKNSFEQLCINIANEQIQFYFNQHIFAWEQDEYLNEDVDARVIEYEDNRPLLDLFLQKPMGMLSLLDEESRFPQATDQTLVIYNAGGFLAKNRDTLPADIVLLLRSSENELIRKLVTHPLTKTGNLAHTKGKAMTTANTLRTPQRTINFAKGEPGESSHHPRETTNMRTQTVASYFRYSLMDLLSKMVAGQPHFVRCIKPNNDRQASKFDREKVMVQLRYTGVLETAKIRRQGYSHRIVFANFIKRYFILAFRAHEEPAATPETCAAILEKAKLENWALGKTKVFLKYYHVEHLNLMVRHTTDRIVLVQAYVRGWMGVKRYRRTLESREQNEAKAAVVLQSNYRGYKERKKLRERHKTRSGDELVPPPPAAAERDAGGQEPVIPEEEEEDDPSAVAEGKERVAEGPLEEEEDSDDGTEKAEDDDEEHTEVGEELDVEDAEDVPGEGDGERDGGEEGEAGAEEEEVHPEQEAKAATVLQSNFRGHRERKKLEEEGKIPARKQKGKSLPGEGGQSATERPADAETTKEEETPGVSAGGGEPGPVEDEAKAAVVLQSNFRGHKERKRLEEEGKIPKKKNKKGAASQDPPRVEAVPEEEEGRPEPQEGAPADGQAEVDEEKAATVLQSNFRGHLDRKKLRAGREGGEKTTRVEPVAEEPTTEGDREEEELLEVTDVLLDHKGESESQTDGDTFEEEQAAVKIQSQFRGHKDRKNLKASKATAQRAAEEVEDFSKEITKVSQDYVNLQQKLNEIILAHQSNPDSNGMFVKGNAVNGFPVKQPSDLKVQRTPRRTQQPKTLNTPEDATYYNLIHRSVQDDKRRPRKQGPGKLLDVDDQYYQGLSGSPKERRTSTASSRKTRQSRERALSEPESPKPAKDKRHSVPRMPSTESQTEDNPYDYRRLLRKTSQRRRLIKHY
ncbi:myosin-IIIa [Osmerus mordax]|uniref:myosin-IIIa n=1 Tax=Osmerus mordax TaxID=8014 RepID=UPI00350EEE25